MSTNRRSFLKYTAAAGAALGISRAAAQPAGKSGPAVDITPNPGYKRIAAEEAWGPPELFDAWIDYLENHPGEDPSFETLWNSPDMIRGFGARLAEMGEGRIADMDATDIDKQILALTAPGVQVFDADTATNLAALSNDRLAEAVRNRPDRYAGMAAVAPQDPVRAAKEIERGVTKLGLKGVIISSHTKGEYLAEEKFWPIFEAAEAVGAPIYIHPRAPSPGMLAPFKEYDLYRGDLGFGVEVAFHTQAIINAGVFDRFPDLKLVIGHGGEGIPYNLYRIDATHEVRQDDMRAANPPSYYMKRNVYITNSGVAWAPMVTFAQQVLGVDQVLYAMDYPYQFDAEEVAAMDRLPISYADKKKFFQENAERVFNL